LLEIQKLDSGIQTYNDVMELPTGTAFYEYVGRGIGFLEAFKLANMEALMERQAGTMAAAASRQAINNARSKDHLGRTKGRGGGAASVSREELTAARLFMPDATEAEITEYYRKYREGEN